MLETIKSRIWKRLDWCIPPLVGRVDGVFAGDLTGWVKSEDCPPHAIHIVTDRDHTIRFGCHIPHSGAELILGQGKHGFAVPVELLPPYEKFVSVIDSRGRLLRGGRVQIRHTPPTSKDSRFFIVHIPKTAGITLQAFLLRNLRNSTFCPVYDNEAVHLSQREFLALPEYQRANFRVVMGHLGPSFARNLASSVRLITFLRRPMDRLRSHILHHLRVHGEAGFMVTTPQGVEPLDHAINHGALEIADNMQTRMLGEFHKAEVPVLSEMHLEKVTQDIQRRFAFVGFTENSAADIIKLGNILGIRASRVPRENVSPKRLSPASKEMLARIDWKRVQRRNEIDETLYEWARRERGEQRGSS